MMIQHNIEAMNTYRQLKITGGDLTKSARNLSSGYKINIAADDAAGLSISEKMRKQIRGLTKATENSEDGISMVQVADGALAEVHDMLDRCIELSIQAANGTNSESDRAKIQEELDQIIREIDTIQERTKFNEIYVLKGDYGHTYEKTVTKGQVITFGGLPEGVIPGPAFADGNLTEQYTASNGTKYPAAASMDFTGFQTSKLINKGFYATCSRCTKYYNVEFVSGTGVTQETPAPNTTIFKVGVDGIADGDTDELFRRIKEGCLQGGALGGHFTLMEQDPQRPGKFWMMDRGLTPVPAGSDKGLVGAGVKKVGDVTKITDRFTIVPQQLALQVGSEAGNFMHLKLATISSGALGIDHIDVRGGYILEERTMTDAKGQVSTKTVKVTGADQAITAFGKAKDMVSADRSRLGAYQNRLEHTLNNLGNVVENTTSAESQIRDTDMAKEMVQYSNKNILMQAGQSMLSQANQSKQGILSLLAA